MIQETNNSNEPSKNFAIIISILSIVTGFWIAKQLMLYRQEKQTGIKKPMDKMDKIGWSIVAVFLLIIIIGSVIGLLFSLL